MMHSNFYCSFFSVFLFLLFHFSVEGHGFYKSTHIKKGNYSLPIYQIYKNNRNRDDWWVTSCDLKSHKIKRSRIVRVGKSTTNCYFRIQFNNKYTGDILCTPSQEFYLLESKQWIPVYQLRPGDVLLGANGVHAITSLQFVKDQLEMYTFEVKDCHTYFVGKLELLTHNMCLPMAVGSICFSFGGGAAAGGTAGSFLGPITCAGGFIIGGVIGIIAKVCSGFRKTHYQLCFDINKIQKKVSNCEYNDNDAQAPGKPTEDDGFVPKKNWDGKKVRNPNGPGYGWPDKKGNVWIPTGPNGHGCPHWDVEKPNGDYENIVPGGRIRGQK